MKIAIIGTGVAGLMAGRKLHELGHELTLFEQAEAIGGHVRTVRIPVALASGETELFPVEHGVFMHDPQMIHPLMNRYIDDWKIEIRTFPLTFSYQNETSGFSWTTKTGTAGRIRDLAILFQTACRSIPRRTFSKDVRYLLQLKKFIDQWEEISTSARFRHMTIGQFLSSENYSRRFRDEWLLPQLHCWWGVTEEVVSSINIQTIVDPMLKVSRCPQYIFAHGWDGFVKKIAAPINDRIQLLSTVIKVSRGDVGVSITTDNGTTATFDHVIFATPPSICADTILDISAEEERLLRSFLTTETEIFLHTDSRWMPRDETWATANLIQDCKGNFCTLWFGELHQQRPPLFVTWGNPLHQAIDQEKIIHTAKMLRTLPTNEYVTSCHEIRRIQGRGNLWYCGAHVDALAVDDQSATPSLWHENAFRSGLNVAELVHQSIEQELVN